MALIISIDLFGIDCALYAVEGQCFVSLCRFEAIVSSSLFGSCFLCYEKQKLDTGQINWISFVHRHRYNKKHQTANLQI